MAKLAGKAKLKEKELRIVIRMMANQLLGKFDQLGKSKATYNWCSKFIARYPQCGDELLTMSQKTVI